MIIYFIFVMGIGWALKKHMKDASAFLEAGRSLPAWVTGLAFISANLGALEVSAWPLPVQNTAWRLFIFIG